MRLGALRPPPWLPSFTCSAIDLVNDRHFAVVVGINQYPAIGNLTAAHADASDFYNWVVSAGGGGVPTGNVHLILSTAEPDVAAEKANPTTDEIYKALERCKEAAKTIPALQWEDTRLYYYAAGHGIAPGEQDAALLAANVTDESLGRHISCECLLKFFSDVQLFREVAIFADCCRPRAADKVRQIPPYWSDASIDNGDVSVFVGFAAIYGQLAYEEQDRPADELRGYFSRALLAGLNGDPDAADPKSGRVTSESLSGFIRERMKQATPSNFRTPLRPWFSTPGAPGIDFGPARGGTFQPGRYPVKIDVASVVVEGLNILDSGERVICPATRQQGNSTTFECELPVGLYEAVPSGPVTPPKTRTWAFRVTEGGANESF